MVDDPSSLPDLFPTAKKQEKERLRLFRIIEDLVKWENTQNEVVLQAARDEIWQSWRRACSENVDHPQAKELFNRSILPPFSDPFSGGGTIPMEAQRLGLEVFASDLNPVAVLINKAIVEIPARFAGLRPVHPGSRNDVVSGGTWRLATGLSEDVLHYGKWVSEQAKKRIGSLYPEIEVTDAMTRERPDLRPFLGEQLTIVSWLWVRTVKSPNPAFSQIDVPLASTFMLSTGGATEAYVEPKIEVDKYHFAVRIGKPADPAIAKGGTKLARGANFRCLMSDAPISGDYIKSEAKAGRMGVRLMAIVAEGKRGRVYLGPTGEQETIAKSAIPAWKPDVPISGTTQYLGVKPYGLERFDQIFTDRQLVTLNTLSDLVQEVRENVIADCAACGLREDNVSLRDGGTGATAYAEAIVVYLAFACSRAADYGSSIATWRPKDNAMRSSLAKQAMQMAWDYAEGSPFGHSSAGFLECVKVVARALSAGLGSKPTGRAIQADAADSDQDNGRRPVVSTDPPYYDNVPYADLSDFFYVWLRRTLRTVYPDLFATLVVPKSGELVAFAYRHDGKKGAEAFFLSGMTSAMHRLAAESHPAFPVTIYYAFKQAENDDDMGSASTGWETFLDATISAGFSITGTWPLRTEGDNRQRGIGANALASSIVLVCRQRASSAVTATRREFMSALNEELPVALSHLQRGNIAPVDLAQAAIGPGMAIYTRYGKVIDAVGNPISVRDALSLINQTLDEALTHQEGDFDSDSRWALAWFDQSGFAEGDFGVADMLSKAKNTSVTGMVNAGILASSRGKVRLLRPDELTEDWDPSSDTRLTAWEIVHHLIRSLQIGGEAGAAKLAATLGAKAEVARELAYRLYSLCERKKRAAEALTYNGLVQSWPEITRMARAAPHHASAGTDDLFGQE